MKYYPILILLFLALAGCNKEETPVLQEGRLTVNEIVLLPYSNGNPGTRTESGTVWKHVFKAEAKLELTSKQTGEKFTLTYDPNDLTKSSEITLPYADYFYKSEITGGSYENHLPYLAEGEFRLNSPTTGIKLEAVTNYGLVTVKNENLKNPPVLVDNGNQTFTLLGGYYYVYVAADKKPVLELVESVFENTIRRSLDIDAYKHYNFVVKISDGSGKISDIEMKDFELIEEELLVNIGEVPNSYSLKFITNLAQEVHESSGLARIDGELWTHNDSGFENILYKINKSNGTVTHRVRISNGQNVDWESLAQSETHLFVGDFGNNSGFRKDLVIYKIDKKELHKNEVTAEKIFFSYPDQTDFSPRFNNQDFDCEAFFFAHDQLHLFTKNWVTSTTRYYSLPSTAGEYSAKLEASFDTQGMVTGADINPRTGDIVLLGYTNQGFSTRSFVWLLSGYPSFRIFEGKKNRLDIGSPAILGLPEGVVLKDDNTGYISSETITLGSTNIPSKLFSFDFKAFF